MKTHGQQNVDGSGEASPPVKNWQQRYGAGLIMAAFVLLLLATIAFEAFKK